MTYTNSRVSCVLMKALTTFIFVSYLAASAEAANWFVRSTATGANTGTDWTDAWSNVTQIRWGSGKVVAGDTVYIAGGTYGRLTVEASGSPGNVITIRRARATNAVCTATAGWNASYDSQPQIDRVNLSGGHSYITFDGEIPLMGIMFTNTITNTDSYTFNLGSGNSGRITVLNSDIVGCGYANVDTGVNESRCWNSGPGASFVNNRIAYCTLRNAPTLLSTVRENGLILEHNVLHSNLTGNTVVLHPNVWQSVGCSDVIMRFCTVSNWQTEGIMMCFASTRDAPNSNWNIYGNIWRDSIPGSSARVLESQYVVNGPINFFNNTVLTSAIGIRVSGANGGTWSADSSSSNNISFGSVSIDFGNANADYNLTDRPARGSHSITDATSASVFVSAADCHIVAKIGASFPRDKGVNLGSAFAEDFEGKLRGADGKWDIGAYEQGIIARPSSPANLRLVSP